MDINISGNLHIISERGLKKPVWNVPFELCFTFKASLMVSPPKKLQLLCATHMSTKPPLAAAVLCQNVSPKQRRCSFRTPTNNEQLINETNEDCRPQNFGTHRRSTILHALCLTRLTRHSLAASTTAQVREARPVRHALAQRSHELRHSKRLWGDIQSWWDWVGRALASNFFVLGLTNIKMHGVQVRQLLLCVFTCCSLVVSRISYLEASSCSISTLNQKNKSAIAHTTVFSPFLLIEIECCSSLRPNSLTIITLI